MIAILKKFPPAISVPLFYLFTAFTIATQILLSTYLGVLILFLIIYKVFVAYSSTPPLDVEGLILWTISLEIEYKVAILSSLITVFGFVIAFNTATRNWKAQLNAQLKMQVAAEIESFFAKVQADINEVEIYIQALVDTVNRIQNGCTVADANFYIKYYQDKRIDFSTTRDRLSKAASEAHTLLGQHYGLLSSNWGHISQFESVNASLAKVADSMWILIPDLDINNPNYIQLFINQVNVNKCLEFVAICKSSRTNISANTGAIRGSLLAPIVGANLSMFWTLFSKRKSFKDILQEVHQK